MDLLPSSIKAHSINGFLASGANNKSGGFSGFITLNSMMVLSLSETSQSEN